MVPTYRDATYYYHGNDSSWTQSFNVTVGDLGELVTEKNFTQFIIEKGAEDITKYRNQLVAGADVVSNEDGSRLNFKCLFNSVPLHALPVSVNLMSNAVLKHFNAVNSKSINVINHPFPRDNAYTFQGM